MDLHPKIIETLAGFHTEEIPNIPPNELPLLNKLRKDYHDKKQFADVDVLFVQHHLGPFLPRVEAMSVDGMDHNRCWFVDIPYSTNAFVREELARKGYRRNQMTRAFSDPLENYGKSQSSRIAFLMQKLSQRNKPKRLLVIDDGAYFARFLKSMLLHAPDLMQSFAGSCVVEQTTRGHRFLQQNKRQLIDDCKLSVVSIARCDTKLDFESPFIGAAVSRALLKAIGKHILSDLKNVAVIGYGAVGKATVSQLAQNMKKGCIDVVDIDAKARKAASSFKSKCKTQCRGLAELAQNKRYELIVGCTGYNSFGLDQRKLLADEAILASGSSAAVEFNRAGFIELADSRPDDEIKILKRNQTKRSGIHAQIKIAQEGGKTFSFLNAGFPVNFDGRLECLPLRIIQATHCLLYAAAIQVMQQKQPGLKKISKKYDRWIFENALKEL